jgi:hypothetical protein
MDINTQTVKAAVDTPEVKELVCKYLAAHVKAEVTRAEVDKITAKILAEFPLYATIKDSKRITDPKYTWLCGDDARMATFYAMTDKAERAAGLKPTSMPDDYCPALVAEDEQRQAENALIEASGGPLGVSNEGLLCSGHGKGLENRQKWIDLVVGLHLAKEREAAK